MNIEWGKTTGDGAIILAQGGIILSGVDVRNGRSGGSGGAIFTTGAVTATNSTFSSNGAEGGYGGAISATSVSLISTTIRNSFSSGRGGAIYASSRVALSAGSVLITNTALDYSAAVTQAYGGGIYLQSGTLSVDASSLINNEANAPQGGEGGAIYAGPSSAITITSSAVDVNSAVSSLTAAESHGGAIMLGRNSRLISRRAPSTAISRLHPAGPAVAEPPGLDATAWSRLPTAHSYKVARKALCRPRVARCGSARPAISPSAEPRSSATMFHFWAPQRERAAVCISARTALSR
ncbi:MAG: hypothetical protein IPO29_19155 [Anaerolineae bacterium]|nr:hypothetical protein [Anaerolineae bacterium]